MKMKVNRERVVADVRDVLAGFNPLQAFIFGSYAYGTPTPDSDVDVLVVSDEESRGYYRKLAKVFYDRQIPVELMIFSSQIFKDRLNWNYFVQDIVAQGIRVR